MSEFERKEYKAKCSACGQDCTVPFEPKEGREVFCRECYRNRRPKRDNRY